MNDLELLCSSIITGDWSSEDLAKITNAVKFKSHSNARLVKKSLVVGDRVQWTSAKQSGRVMQGRVTKIAIKYVTVDTGLTKWRVPASMLTKA